MEKRLIATLLRIVQTPKSDFPAGVGLRDFRQRYGIGLPVGSTSIRFSDKDKVEITALLKAQAGIDPGQVSPGAWEGLTRAQALNLAHDEKLARGTVKRDRISVKAAPGQAMRIAGRSLELPNHAHLDINWKEVDAIEHPCALVVENYEVFDALHRTEITSALTAAGYEQALIIYRGDTNESRKDHVLAFLAAFALPVVLFGDLDPASLVEASSFPNARAITLPVALDQAFDSYGNKGAPRKTSASPALGKITTS